MIRLLVVAVVVLAIACGIAPARRTLMLADRPDPRCRAAKVIQCPDGRVRAFTDTGVCLGVVVQEHEMETDSDMQPIGFFQALVFAVVLILCFGLTLWLGFKGISWFHGVHQ